MKPIEIKTLFQTVKELIEDSRSQVVRNVNTIMIYTNFSIGKMIVEEEQNGSIRANYAETIVKDLSKSLSKEYGKGYSQRNLDYFKQFYLLYHDRIAQTLSAQFGETDQHLGQRTLLIVFADQFKVSWSLYIQLMKIQNLEERHFYEIEAIECNWSYREFQRQYHSALYERLSISRDKKGLRKINEKGRINEDAINVLKSPVVLEFLDLKEDNRYSENDLETAIINKLEHFMMELGKGFLFEGRQRRISLDGDHYWVDLVFYNRLLKCFVLIDLKIGKLTHQDIGQMQMYVNFYDRRIKHNDEKPTLGIILCKADNKSVVEFTLPLDNEQIFSKEYKLYLPSKEELKKQLE
ncbi:YhcG family protein [Mucilaginibacter terrae]|uniref:PDDEXK nuclease domain-containing protein n=1 Tax=Mucilaginibacter terrae TaxID=1955052 RepID=UPI003636083B